MKIYQNIKDFEPTKKVVLTVGTFDGLHFGHQKIIDKVKELSNDIDGESVVLTFSPHPRTVLFPESHNLKLINTLDEKVAELEKSGIDHLIIYPFTKEFSRISALEYVRDFLVNEIKVSSLIIGYDHQFGRNREGNFEYLLELSELYGFEVFEISAQDINEINVSSTKIRNAILEGDVSLANDYLGYNFSVSGKVVRGKELGSSIGFPTANIEIKDSLKIIPKIGSYAVQVIIDDRKFNGMLNIGLNPTVENSTEKLKIEVNIFGFNEMIYEKTITIEFIQRLRDEIKFDSVDSLKSQLAKDRLNSQSLLQ